MLTYWKKYCLNFKQPATTSRDTLTQKPSWFLFIQDIESNLFGVGECSPLAGLSIDDLSCFEKKLDEVCHAIQHDKIDCLQSMQSFPAIQFGLEMALLDLATGNHPLFPSTFTEGKKGIPVNGLIWMSNWQNMRQQIEAKLNQGCFCLKLKIGAVDFVEEYEFLKGIRHQYSADNLEIRVDANGAFSPDEALDKLKKLADLDIHSIEQPIAAGQIEAMADLVEKSPLAIALDEELIGISDQKTKAYLLDSIKPDYIILKPSLIGGFAQATQWINLAQQRLTNWWVTSALESNVGLNAISQWTASLNNPLPQGLGTGLLYTNNIPSALSLQQGYLYYEPAAYQSFSEAFNRLD